MRPDRQASLICTWGETLLLLVVLSMSVPGVRAEESDDSMFARARAAYRENFRRLGVFRCAVEKEQAYTETHYDVLRQRIARIENALPGVLPEHRERVDEFLRQNKADLAARVNNPWRTSAAFVVGSTALQVVKPKGCPLPDVPLERQADLTESFPRCLVLSWSPAQQPPTWFWQGENGKRQFAAQSKQRPQDILDFPVIPVGAACRTFFEPAELSPFDAFFEESEGAIGVMGRERVDGQEVLIVERTGEFPRHRTSVRAWLSVSHGYFPVRIERKGCLKEVDLDEVEPSELIHVSGFFRTESGADYPLSWTIESKVDDDRLPAARVARRGPPYVLYTQRLETWTVSRIQSRQREPTLLSEIGFPDGTSCWDEERKMRFTVGEAK